MLTKEWIQSKMGGKKLNLIDTHYYNLYQSKNKKQQMQMAFSNVIIDVNKKTNKIGCDITKNIGVICNKTGRIKAMIQNEIAIDLFSIKEFELFM